MFGISLAWFYFRSTLLVVGANNLGAEKTWLELPRNCVGTLTTSLLARWYEPGEAHSETHCRSWSACCGAMRRARKPCSSLRLASATMSRGSWLRGDRSADLRALELEGSEQASCGICAYAAASSERVSKAVFSTTAVVEIKITDF